MNTKNKVMTLLALTSGASVVTAFINKYIKFSSTSKNLMEESHSLCFKWRLGNIHYTKTGNGRPILLVHDLDFSSSGYEWNQLIGKLKDHYTVYTIDLLGCGRSEKPNLTYTNYLYVQLLCDFIKTEIGRKTDLITTGHSCSIAVMACNNSSELFGQLMLINPESLSSCGQYFKKNIRFYKLILDLPVIGTLLYHIASSRSFIQHKFQEHYFYNPYSAKPFYVEHYLESAHLGAYPKAIFSSLECGYTKCNITTAFKKINNSIFIIGGALENNIQKIIDEYKTLNPSIESSIISKTKHLPHMEDPEKVLELIYMFFS